MFSFFTKCIFFFLITYKVYPPCTFLTHIRFSVSMPTTQTLSAWRPVCQSIPTLTPTTPWQCGPGKQKGYQTYKKGSLRDERKWEHYLNINEAVRWPVDMIVFSNKWFWLTGKLTRSHTKCTPHWVGLSPPTVHLNVSKSDFEVVSARHVLSLINSKCILTGVKKQFTNCPTENYAIVAL